MTREPTGGDAGLLIRRILRQHEDWQPEAVAALFVADRLDHITKPIEGISALLESGSVVLCDRFYLSSYAYQGALVTQSWVIEINDPCTRLLRPDVHLFLDLPLEKCLERLESKREHLELYENGSNMRAVRQRYFDAFSLLGDSEDVRVIDADCGQQELEDRAWRILLEFL
jgi:dTMP kinase